MLPDMLEQHPAVRAADQQRQAAAQEVDGARWQYFPTPSVGAESSNQTNPLLDSKTRFARLQQPLWTGGRLTAQTDRARAQLELAEAGWREQRQSLATRWVELWAEAVAAATRVEAYVESEALHQRYVRRVQARASEGQIARSEIQLSVSRLANVQAELELARTQQQQALNKLRQMWGRPWSVAGPLAFSATYSAATAPDAEPPEDHPVLQKGRAQIQLAQAEADLAKARLSPEIYVRGEIVHGDITGETRKAYIGLSTSYGGGLSSLSAIGSAQSRVEAQRQDLEVRRRDLSDQLTADQLQRTSQQQRALQLQQALEAAQAYLQSSETQFDNGRRSWQELMNSAREKAQLRAQLADASAQAWLAAERLRLNTQGLDSYLSSSAPLAAPVSR
ncbi:TolC family protein [Limnohabitans sp. JUR4]|uniref:TolC family protein n=2 Tax=Limnohabitans radicicola TaxID=2771427 RepID=A0A927FKG4_9BURK|nr:TolC family protein [Limnohabitans radicicola]